MASILNTYLKSNKNIDFSKKPFRGVVRQITSTPEGIFKFDRFKNIETLLNKDGSLVKTSVILANYVKYVAVNTIEDELKKLETSVINNYLKKKEDDPEVIKNHGYLNYMNAYIKGSDDLPPARTFIRNSDGIVYLGITNQKDNQYDNDNVGLSVAYKMYMGIPLSGDVEQFEAIKLRANNKRFGSPFFSAANDKNTTAVDDDINHVIVDKGNVYFEYLTRKQLNDVAEDTSIINYEKYRNVLKDNLEAPIISRTKYYPERLKMSRRDADGKLILDSLYSSDIPTSITDLTNDFVKFYFRNPDTEEFIQFRNTITDIDYKVSSTWGDINYIGNPSTKYIYNTLTRDVSFDFVVVAYNSTELRGIYKRLHRLAQLVAPGIDSNEGIIRGNILELTIGNFIKGEPCIVRDVGFSISDDSTWDIGLRTVNDEDDTGDNYTNNNNYEIPIKMDVGLSVTLIGKTVPTSTYNNYFGTIGWH